MYVLRTVGQSLGSETGLRSDWTMRFRSRSRRGTETATGKKVIFRKTNLVTNVVDFLITSSSQICKSALL